MEHGDDLATSTKLKKLKVQEAEAELDREFNQPMSQPPKKAKRPKSITIPTSTSSSMAYTLPPPTPCIDSCENPLKALPGSTAAVASAIEATGGPYVYPLGERGDRQLMLFNNGVVLFSKSDMQKFVELDLNR